MLFVQALHPVGFVRASIQKLGVEPCETAEEMGSVHAQHGFLPAMRQRTPRR